MTSLAKTLGQNNKVSALKNLSDASKIINSEEIELPDNNDKINVKIVYNVSDFIEPNVKSNENCTKDTNHSATRACFGQRQPSKEEENQIRIRLGTTCRWFSKVSNAFNTPFYHLNHHHNLSSLLKLQHDSIYDFCHSNESSRVDSNSQQCINVILNGAKVKHPGRTW